MSGIPSLSAVLQNRSVRGDERRRWGRGGCGMSGIPLLSAVLQNRSVRGMKGGVGGGGAVG